MIYILSDAIRTGKTTALLEWIEDRDDVDGVLCPDGDDGKRYFLKIKSKETLLLEADTANDDVISIGPFLFVKSAFDTANAYICAIASEKQSQYIIIDELGKLELKNQGLHIVAERLIPEYAACQDFHLILVVRDALVKDIVNHYHITEYTILKKEDLKAVL